MLKLQVLIAPCPSGPIEKDDSARTQHHEALTQLQFQNQKCSNATISIVSVRHHVTPFVEFHPRREFSFCLKSRCHASFADNLSGMA
jgi:hypothetical protein